MGRSVQKLRKRGKSAKSAKARWRRKKSQQATSSTKSKSGTIALTASPKRNTTSNHIDNSVLPQSAAFPSPSAADEIIDWPEMADDLPSLIEEKETPNLEGKHKSISGNRLVDLDHLSRQYEIKEAHRKTCTYGKYEFIREIQIGLVSTLLHKCMQCNKEFRITTQPPDKIEATNDAAVWGALSIGIGHHQLEELFAIMSTPVMSSGKFQRHEFRVGNAWMSHLTTKMKAAGEEEKRLAIQRGDLIDGVPFISVIVDGGWSKRSYGHSFSAPSGVVVIVGAHTNKILYIGVKNKFCLACSLAKKNRSEPKSHVCFLNFKGPSSSMEQVAIVEGFNASIEQHGLIYRYLIGDGDSSVFTRVQKQVKGYGRMVEKRECANHIIKCYKSNLYKILANTKLYELEARNVLKPLIERLSNGARAAIRYCEENATQLKNDFKNGPLHVFGCHDHCSDRFCSRKNAGELNKVDLMKETKVWAEIQRLTDGLVRQAHTLIYNLTTNQAERLMGLVSKFNGGKRVNNAMNGGYERRCMGAALAHTSGPAWHASPLKDFLGWSPSAVFKKVMHQRKEKSISKRKLFEDKPRNKARSSTVDDGGDDYALNALQELDVEPDVSPEKLDILKNKYISDLQAHVDTPEKAAQLERDTVGQRECQLWRDRRRGILTASHFSSIFKRRANTSCHNKVNDILYPKKCPLSTREIQYGIDNESKAIECYQKAMKVQVEKCGLFINPQWPYLGASPDGLVGTDGLVEVKCLPSIGNLHPLEAAAKPNNKICAVLQDGQLKLKTHHAHWFQIQGQLNISDRQYCDLILYSDGGFEVTRIERDSQYWEDEILPKLHQYFHECMLPEIVDGRVPRKMRIREPQFIEESIKAWIAKNEQAAENKRNKERRTV